MGNVRSVYNALDALALDARITADPKEVADADRLILPGVGAFGDAMGNLRARGLTEILTREVIERKKPFLGICLGMQLLAESSSEHGEHAGLGWLKASVARFRLSGNGFKVPHMGWNDVTPRLAHPVLHGLREGQFVFYFVHSFHMNCVNPGDVAASCDYGYPFAAAVARENIFATQFHPEKSQDNGLQILRNFASWEP
jgi:glutamine amidotransferase